MIFIKKKRPFEGRFRILLTKITVNLMKCIMIFCALVVLQSFSFDNYAQNTLNTTESQRKTVKEVLTKIEKEHGFYFTYDSNIVDTKRVVNLDTSNKNLKEILKELFAGQQIQYELKDKHIILYKAKETSIHQQNERKITGHITDEQGEPIVGATVAVTGNSKSGTITDFDGKFTINVPDNAVLSISYIGFISQQIKVDNKNSFSIVLIEDSRMLDDVVVIGYGTVKKKDLTGSVAAISGDNVASRKTTQLSSALQGAISGVLVTRDNNAPGSSASNIYIRGITTIGDASPLVIVDGVPGNINMINPNDVESISVLKDAASASIYGARAAAGVILVTTKRADTSKLSLSYAVEYGWEKPTQRPQYVGVQRFLEMANELRYNDNTEGGMYQEYSQDQVENWVANNKTDPNAYPITDWESLIMKSSAPRVTHNFSISGGTKNVSTKASFSYDDVDGLYSDRNYKRYMTRVNNDFTINPLLSASLDFNWRRTNSQQPTYNPLNRMRITPAVYAALWDDGRIAEGKSGANPYGQLIGGGDTEDIYNRLGGKAALDFTPFAGFKLSGIIAPTYNLDHSKSFRTATFYTAADDPDRVVGSLGSFATNKLTETRNQSHNITAQIIATYIKTINQHNINLMAGYESYYSKYESLETSKDKYPLTEFPYLSIGPDEIITSTGNAFETAYRSYFGRIMYSYANRYLLQANIRRDGSSRFHKDHRWGTFPSFSAGWVVSEEKFMKNSSLDWLSFFKLRASWGTLGNERIGNYPYQSTIDFEQALFYQNGAVIPQMTAAQRKWAVENITWETTTSIDLGIDLSFLSNRLQFTADYYNKKTKDMLLNVKTPDYGGLDDPEINAGVMRTKGYEIEASWREKRGDWSYEIALNFSDFLSKMGNLRGTQFLGNQVKMEGSEFNEWYGYLSDGLFLTQEDLDNSPTIDKNVTIGDIKYLDVSGPDGVPDGKISPDYDRVLLGGSLPRYMFGGRINASYRDFDLSLAFQGVGKQNVRMTATMVQPLRENYGSMPQIIDGKYWSSLNSDEQNANALYPKLTFDNRETNYAMSDFWLFDGRYIRLKNITFGYTLPKHLGQKAYINNVRFYISANDLLCFSKYPKGWDPEMGDSSYPITTSVLFGLSLNF